MITENMNLFGTPDPLILCLIMKHGKQFCKKAIDVLLNITAISEGESTKFILEYFQDSIRFNKSVRRQIIGIFATEAGTKKIKSQ